MPEHPQRRLQRPHTLLPDRLELRPGSLVLVLLPDHHQRDHLVQADARAVSGLQYKFLEGHPYRCSQRRIIHPLVHVHGPHIEHKLFDGALLRNPRHPRSGTRHGLPHDRAAVGEGRAQSSEQPAGVFAQDRADFELDQTKLTHKLGDAAAGGQPNAMLDDLNELGDRLLGRLPVHVSHAHVKGVGHGRVAGGRQPRPLDCLSCDVKFLRIQL
mmetsp:Transcript_10266/g.23446  ORF Transcript_10266/g.23446 Transcript_10266/m.23446 type:complete len:213 (-) Transcript_10266:781-1419(-)